MNNENKEILRNGKRRIEQKNEMNDKFKILLNKIKAERKNKNKKNDKIKQLEIELNKNKSVINPAKLDYILKELNKTLVVDKKLHVIKQKLLVEYDGEFEIFWKFQLVIKSENHI